MGAFIDLTGQRFGRLVVVKYAGCARNYQHIWTTSCDCGGTAIVAGRRLRAGRTKSCGCIQLEALAKKRSLARLKSLKHGHAWPKMTPEYHSWRGAKQRCSNPNADGYELYGGRGIAMCARWRDSFETFLADMGPRPAGKTLDRIDNDGHYEPGNCRWATKTEQVRNRRRRPK